MGDEPVNFDSYSGQLPSEERKRRLEASKRAAEVIAKMSKNFDKDSVQDMEGESVFNDFERDCILGRFNGDIKSTASYSLSERQTIEEVKALMGSEMLSSSQKLKIFNNVRKEVVNNEQHLSEEEHLDSIMNSELISDDEQLDVLFQIDKFKVGSTGLNDEVTAINVSDLISEDDVGDESEDIE